MSWGGIRFTRMNWEIKTFRWAQEAAAKKQRQQEERKAEDEQMARDAGHDIALSLPVLPCPNSALSDQEEIMVRRLLAEFADIFNDGTRPLTTTNLLKARLETGDAVPISIPPRRVAPFLREAMAKEVKRLEIGRAHV